jgi:L-fuconolactonase
MVIDAHQHFWRVERGDYHWMSPDLTALYRDYGPDDLASLLERHGIGRTILVQAAQTLAETEFMLDIAARTPFVAGVVGWAEFADPEAPDTIARLARDPLLVGLRPMVQDIADDDWLVRADLAPAFRALQEHGLVFDALVFPRHLSRLLVVLDRYPDLPWWWITGRSRRSATVGSIPGAPTWRRWRRGRTRSASSQAGHGSRARLAPRGSAPLRRSSPRVFGPERLLWGSDWPVVNLAGGYDRWRRRPWRFSAGSRRVSGPRCSAATRPGCISPGGGGGLRPSPHPPRIAGSCRRRLLPRPGTR